MIVLDLLMVFGLCFGMQHKAGPHILRLIGVPEDAQSVMDVPGWHRRFMSRLLTCSYCSGFHAGWIGWLVHAYAPAWVTWALAGAALCWIVDVVVGWFELARG